MRIGIVGINHKLADLHLRERFAKACKRRFCPTQSLHPEHSFVLLSTCNRTELYFFSEDLTISHTYILSILRHELEEEFDQKLYSFFGYDCFLHLCRVTAGLDSAVIAESEIQNQVKIAYETTKALVSLPGDIHHLFQKSLQIGKKVRTAFPLRPGLPDIEHAVLHVGQRMFETKTPKILFIGASTINLKILSFLKTKYKNCISLCNRTKEEARLWASKHQVKYLEWNSESLWDSFDWMIFGTKATDYLLKEENFKEDSNHPKLIIDLCVPRNVKPSLAHQSGVTLLNIDQINQILNVRHERMNTTLGQAETLIAEATRYHLNLFLQRPRILIA